MQILRGPQSELYHKDGPTENANPRVQGLCGLKKRAIVLAAIVIGLLLVGLAVGLGVGLSRQNASSNATNNTTPAPTSINTRPNITSNSSYWNPVAGSSWQIVLLDALTDTSTNASIYDIDLFTNPTSTIGSLHAVDRKVICYFSAGSYENFRPDSSLFQKSDCGKELKGWPNEYWLNTSSPNVRSIMQARLNMAVQKGCDGVDPDNVDGYDNDNGIGLTKSTAVDYVRWLAAEAHGRGLALGLKNAAGIISSVLDVVQWEVNEQCVEFNECNLYQPFINAGKPVFHIEYPTQAGTPNVVSDSDKARICGNKDLKGFSTVLKNMVLDDWVEYC